MVSLPLSPTKRLQVDHLRSPHAATQRLLSFLTEQEKELFQILKATVRHFDLGTLMEEGLVVRAAGGWVRDKILYGDASNDIDVAVDTLSGEEFAHKVKDYVDTQYLPLLESRGFPPRKIISSKIGVVQENPEQSKHLRTASFRLCGLDLDVNNLRTETYTEHSRVPSVDLGTPLQDAQRRDFTINTLFFNVMEEKVEDMLELGLQDMQKKIIRTPISPFITFEDDPLRILRAVRFKSRFSFAFAEDVFPAIADKKQLLSKKVSRERVGVEIKKMLAKRPLPHAVDAIRTLKDLDLLEESLGFGKGGIERNRIFSKDGEQVEFKFECGLTALSKSEFIKDEVKKLSDEEYFLFTLSAFLLDSSKKLFKDLKNKSVPLASVLVREGMKLTNQDASSSASILENASNLLEILQRSNVGEIGVEQALGRLEIGRFIKSAGVHTKISILICECMRERALAVGKAQGMVSPKHFLSYLEASDLADCFAWRPLLNGKDIQKLFGVKGPEISKILTDQMEFLFLKGQDCGEKELLEYLRSRYAT